MIFFFSSQVKGFRMKKYPRCVLIDNSTFLVIFFLLYTYQSQTLIFSIHIIV